MLLSDRVRGAVAALGVASFVLSCTTTDGGPSAAPVVAVFLDRAPNLDTVADPRLTPDSIARDGLVPAAFLDDATGKPQVGDGEHAALVESDATYARLDDAGGYAPATLEAWQARFGFPARAADESLAAWRARAGVYVYYNQNELGLGRELGCASFDDRDPSGGAARGLACFVVNYGATFNNRDVSYADAVAAAPPRNTVCIAYIPSLPIDAQVQFFVYGADGRRQSWAQLDHLGPRPHPFVCTDCHGGAHDHDLHLTRDAHFLPTQPSRLWFGPTAPYDLASQAEAIRRVNELTFGAGATGTATPMLTDDQRTWLAASYAHDGGDIHRAGQAMVADWAPATWSTRAADRELYTKVLDPYCLTCHAALAPSARRLFAAPEELQPFVDSSVCGSFAMPNAQATSHRFWNQLVIVDGRTVTAADALLGWAGLDRASCRHLDQLAGCLRDGVPDHELCGNRHSGTVCLPSGQCGPELDTLAAGGGAPGVLGYCTLDGARRCPVGQACSPASRALVDGWSGGVCLACPAGETCP